MSLDRLQQLQGCKDKAKSYINNKQLINLKHSQTLPKNFKPWPCYIGRVIWKVSDFPVNTSLLVNKYVLIAQLPSRWEKVILREAAWKFWESKISDEKSKFFLFCQIIPFCELVSKIIF